MQLPGLAVLTSLARLLAYLLCPALSVSIVLRDSAPATGNLLHGLVTSCTPQVSWRNSHLVLQPSLHRDRSLVLDWNDGDTLLFLRLLLLRLTFCRHLDGRLVLDLRDPAALALGLGEACSVKAANEDDEQHVELVKLDRVGRATGARMRAWTTVSLRCPYAASREACYHAMSHVPRRVPGNGMLTLVVLAW